MLIDFDELVFVQVWLVDTLPAPFNEEIRAIATETDLPLGEVVLYNIFYEIFTVCTSIVAQDPSG